MSSHNIYNNNESSHESARMSQGGSQPVLQNQISVGAINQINMGQNNVIEATVVNQTIQNNMPMHQPQNSWSAHLAAAV